MSAATLLATGPADLSVYRHAQAGDGDALIRELAARRLGCAIGAIVLERDAKGVPRLRGAAQDLRVSLASRGSQRLIALATQPVGVDIESVGRAQDVPWNVLHPLEREVLRSIADEADRYRHFLAIWTGKEAWLKALGTGLRKEPSSFAICPEDGTFSVVAEDGHAPAVARAGAFALGGEDFVWACVVL